VAGFGTIGDMVGTNYNAMGMVGLGDGAMGIAVGGALVKWPKYFFPPIPTKFGDSIRTSLLVNIPNFQGKKMTGRSLLIKKCRLTSETGVKHEAY
jgi:hypothetical protein